MIAHNVHVYLDVLDGLGDGDPLDAGLPPQLLHHLALLLDTRHFYRLSNQNIKTTQILL